jgi:hypothetical protein
MITQILGFVVIFDRCNLNFNLCNQKPLCFSRGSQKNELTSKMDYNKLCEIFNRSWRLVLVNGNSS